MQSSALKASFDGTDSQFRPSLPTTRNAAWLLYRVYERTALDELCVNCRFSLGIGWELKDLLLRSGVPLILTTGDPLPENPEQTGIIIVDHGSRRRESNKMLHAAADAFAKQSAYEIVEAAHMELAEPTITQAFRRCVERGATRVIVFPYFLSPGRHWTEDIPSLVAEAAASHPDVSWLVTAPFGLHPGMLNIINDRIRMCVEAASSHATGGQTANCDVCGDGQSCSFRDAATQ